MKTIEKLNLVSLIGRELQSRMGYADIDIFLKNFGIDVARKTSGTNSKWVYVKELLSDASETTVLGIADELDIPHGHTISRGSVREDSRFWTPGYFRLFISHQSVHKLKATALKEGLKRYAISGFVAHEDINPTLEWQEEIEKALSSMDALTAILMPGFHESSWTDQEIGYALGRGSLVVPLRNGMDPYGFIGKVQGIQCLGKSVAQVANSVFQALASNGATRNKIATALVDQIVAASNQAAGLQLFESLRQVGTLAQSHLERLRDNLGANPLLSTDTKFVGELNQLLAERDITPYELPSEEPVSDDEIPF